MRDTYRQMAEDRAEKRRQDRYGRLRDEPDPRKWAALTQEEVRREREEAKDAHRYTQPLAASWLDFLRWRGVSPVQVDEWPDDYTFSEWLVYTWRVRYDIPL